MPATSLFPKSAPAKTACAQAANAKISLPRVWKYGLALAPIVAVAWFLRARHPHFSSAYMDESIYVLYGRMFLSRHFETPIDRPLDFTFGWYLWPVLAAWADRIRGIVAVRELAAALGALSVLAMYGFARRVFTPAVGLISALLFALLGPAVFASRIATRDSGALFFFAVGLWLFARAWETNGAFGWLLAGLSFFAAFLCKYLVAIYFPFFVILALFKGRRAIAAFAAPLFIFCAAYAIYYRESLFAILRYAHAYGSLKAPLASAEQIYFTGRLDFWILLALSVFAFVYSTAASRSRIYLLYLGVAVLLAFQALSRADYDYWKHVNYALMFLVPLAAGGVVSVLAALPGKLRIIATGATACVLAVGLGWLGNAWRMNRFVFWPDAEPAVAYFHGRLGAADRVLVDDTVFRYYFSPPLHQWQITDPFYFRYGTQTGTAAYTNAVRDGYFDYVVLDGGIGEDAKRLRAAIQPNLGVYALLAGTPDPTLGREIEIYARKNPPPNANSTRAPQIQITSPAAGAVVITNHTKAQLTATITGAAAGDYALVDVFTNQWYAQGGKLALAGPSATLNPTIYLAGEGSEQCHHIVRVRLFDSANRLLASAMNFNVTRANPDGGAPACR